MNNEELVWHLKINLFWWGGILSFFFCVLYTIYTGEWWWLLSVVLVQKILSPLSNGIALHRYFAHRSFETGPIRHKFLLWISVLGAAGSPISYAITHRHHHKHSDSELDIHSPKNGILDALGYWIVRGPAWLIDVKQVSDLPKDLIRMKDVQFIHRNYYTIWALLGIVSLLINWKVLFLFTLPLIGFYIIGSGLYINVLSHLKLPGSYRSYQTTDNSYNNKWIHRYTMQEGLHNNHHRYPNRYNQAIDKDEFDFCGYVIEKLFKTH
jgi:stearoyl-CoA desaturase (delta-9 desaturase)